VHPSKTEVRFRQQTCIHDFVRDSVRAALMKARPVPQFLREIAAQPSASQALTPGALPPESSFALRAEDLPPQTASLGFTGSIAVEANAAHALAAVPAINGHAAACNAPLDSAQPPAPDTPSTLASLKPIGQVRNSFILAINGEGLWI